MALKLWAYMKSHLGGILLHCMNESGSHKDRPFILETLNEDGGYMREIAFVKAHQRQA